MFDSVKEAFKRYLQIGTSDERTRDENQQLFVSNLFSFIGYSLSFAMAISAALRDDIGLSIGLLATSVILVFCHHIHRFPSLGNTIVISTRVDYACLLVLMVYLVYSGGLANTGPMWIYIVPPVAFFFNGLRKGLRSIGAFIVVISVMLFYPEDVLLGTSYSFDFKTRLIYSFLTVTLLFGFYEHSRQRSYDFIEKLSQDYERQAMHDPLTNLPNRRGMRSHLEREYNRSKRGKSTFTVLICDIDHFKKVNDKYLHDGGDYVLEALSEHFTKNIRKQDIVSRWGGEEFLFLLPETNAKDAYLLAEKIRTSVENYVMQYNQQSLSVTLSIGLTEVSSGMNIDQAINKADRHLYEAKKTGRNRTMPQLNNA